MSKTFSYERYDRRAYRPAPATRHRSTLGYWVPLVVTLTLAAGGVAAWVWSERQDSDESDDADLSYGEESIYEEKREGASGAVAAGAAGAAVGAAAGASATASAEGGIVGAVTGAIRRTPSPQEVFGSASKKVAASIAAAGTLLGGALYSIREKEDDYEDHNRWSEGTEVRKSFEAKSSHGVHTTTHAESFVASTREGSSTQAFKPVGKRKTVAIVVSAESTLDSPQDIDQGTYHIENASLLDHLPPTDFSRTQLFVLIYCPTLKSRPESPHTQSLGSSFANIDTPAQTPGDELQSMEPQPYTPSATTPAFSATTPDNALYNSMYNQALRLVEKPTMIMPFTTLSGHIHMLKHLAPDLVYITEGLTGENGKYIEEVKSWLGQVIVVVGANGTGLSGLVDTEDEGEGGEGGKAKRNAWWETSDMVGLGKGVEIVDGARIVDDYERRAGGKE